MPQTLKDDFDEYCEENELSITDTQRELLRAGLEAKKYDEQDAADQPAGGLFERSGGGAMASLVAFVGSHTFIGPTAAAMVAVAALGIATYLATVAILSEFRASVGSKQQSHSG